MFGAVLRHITATLWTSLPEPSLQGKDCEATGLSFWLTPRVKVRTFILATPRNERQSPGRGFSRDNSLGSIRPRRMVDPCEREIARGITLLAGLPEQRRQ